MCDIDYEALKNKAIVDFNTAESIREQDASKNQRLYEEAERNLEQARAAGKLDSSDFCLLNAVRNRLGKEPIKNEDKE